MYHLYLVEIESDCESNEVLIETVTQKIIEYDCDDFLVVIKSTRRKQFFLALINIREKKMIQML